MTLHKNKKQYVCIIIKTKIKCVGKIVTPTSGEPEIEPTTLKEVLNIAAQCFGTNSQTKQN